MRPTTTKQSLLTLAALILGAAAHAQETSAPTSSAPAESAPTATAAPATTMSAATEINPVRGSTMDAVKSKFGAPSQEMAAVGNPPITRWEYPGYVVFFEHDRVLHTVVVKN